MNRRSRNALAASTVSLIAVTATAEGLLMWVGVGCAAVAGVMALARPLFVKGGGPR